jgi:hypothetical protein
MVYGDSGTGKTSLLAALAKQLNGTTRVVTCEEHPALLNVPNIQVWPIGLRPFPFESLQQAVEGWWPLNPQDPKSKLFPPTDETWATVRSVMFEGTATFSDYLMGGYAYGGLAARIGRGEKVGTGDETFRFDEGTVHVGGVGRSHYLLVQKRMMDLIVTSRRLPTIVMWTAHEIRLEDDSRPGFYFVGPEVAGKAATYYINRNYANVWHLASSAGPKVNGEAIPEYSLYVQDHYPRIGDIQTPYKAKIQIDGVHQSKLPHPIKGDSTKMASSLIALLKEYGPIDL